MVTSGTDAEDGMDYQGGGSSVRGLERQGSQTLSLRTPGPSISASPPRITSMVSASSSRQLRRVLVHDLIDFLVLPKGERRKALLLLGEIEAVERR